MKKSATGLCAVLLAAFSLPAAAGTQISAPIPPPADMKAEKDDSVFDKIWGWATLYKNSENPVIEEVSITGRYQGQYYNVDSDTNQVDDWENRRFHLGLQLAMFNRQIKIKAEMASAANDTFDPFYAGLKDAYIEYSPSKSFNLRVGKFEPKFSKEFSTSSREILTFERSQLVNQFKPDYTTGAAVFGKVEKWSWYGAFMSNAVDREFGQLDGGFSGYASIGYDLKDALNMKEAEVRLDYTHSEIDRAEDNVFNYFDNGVSLNFTGKQGKFGIITDFLGGFSGRSNAFSWVLMPTYDITDKLQAVLRGTLSVSDEDNGLAPQGRYERTAGGTAGDEYKALSAGLNYYLYGHKLKLMTEMGYADMNGGTGPGFEGWTFMSGVRVAW